MRYLKPFKESSEFDRFYNILSSSIAEIRNVFIEFEDDDIIKYNLSNVSSSFTSRTTNIDTYIKHASCILPRRKELTLKCEVSLSYKLNNTDLNDWSKDKYEDLLVCCERIQAMDYECSIAINKYLPQYGKAIILITIPI